MQKRNTIKSCVLAAAHPSLIQSGNGSSGEVRGNDVAAELLHYLSSNDTREVVYRCCLDALKDPQYNIHVSRLLLSCVAEFSPCRETLDSIGKECRKLGERNIQGRAVFDQLYKLVKYYRQRPLALPHRSESAIQSQLRNVPPARRYVYLFSLQAPLKASDVSKYIKIKDSEPALGEAQKSPFLLNSLSTPLFTAATVCKDYVDQYPLVCSDEIVQSQLAVLANFWDHYRTNPAVVNASVFLIKEMCDGYVSKLSFGSPYIFFRSVTICYLPTLVEWMESDYLCVCTHVYDFLLTLSAHLQLVDTRGQYPGCTDALQTEVVWLLLQVLDQQSVRKPYDEVVWTAAAKCALAVIPPRHRWLIDSRALLQFMRLPGLAEMYPQAFTIFAEAFTLCLLHREIDVEDVQFSAGKPAALQRQDGSAASPSNPSLVALLPEETLVFNIGELHKLGSNVIADVLALYRKSITVGARLAFFKILFVWVVEQRVLSSAGDENDSDRKVVEKCLNELVALDFSWFLYQPLFYLSGNVQKKLPSTIEHGIPPSNIGGAKGFLQTVVSVVKGVLQLIRDDAALPREVEDFLRGKLASETSAGAPDDGDTATDSGSATRGAAAKQRPLSEVITEATATVILLLREQSDSRTYNLAWRLALHCIRRSASSDPELVTQLAKELVNCSSSTGERERAFIRRVCPDLLSSLAQLCLAQPEQAVDGFNEIMERFLFAPDANPNPLRVISLCHRLLECVSTSSGVVWEVSPEMDVTNLLISGELQVSQAAARALGPRLLLGFYRVLANEQSAVACRTRFILISILQALSEDGGNKAHFTYDTARLDPYLKVAALILKKSASSSASQPR